MNLGLVVPGFSADATDWCIPALRHFVRTLNPDDTRVFAVRYPYYVDRYCIDSADVIALGGADRQGPRTPLLWQRTLQTIAAEHRRRPFDVLHAFWATESGLLAALAGRVLRVPVLVSLAGGELVALPDIGYGDQRRPWERLKIAAALRLASAVSAGSRYLVGLAQRRVRRRVEWLPLGVDTRMFRLSERPRERDALLHVGTLTPVKDQRSLLAAFAQLRQRRPDTTLTIVGDGPLRRNLHTFAAELGLNGGVRFVGARDHGELAAIYQSASTFVLSSRHEAQGMVALEAASCGLPVVGTRVGNMPELTPDTCAPVGDSRALTARIEQVLQRDTGEATPRQIIESTFTLEHSVRRFRSCYAQLAC
ncbi:MAG TPA: glycosyltransferase [Chloroflexota bacterium]|nr:glycosyltransferase [Chloroflexota bacterium]